VKQLIEQAGEEYMLTDKYIDLNFKDFFMSYKDRGYKYATLY